MGKLTKPMSLSIPSELTKELDKAAELKKTDRSKLARDLFQDFMGIDNEVHELLKHIAYQRNCKVWEVVEFLVDKFPLNDQNVKPVVLRIPVDTANNRDKLESWLEQKSSALVNHLHPK